MHRRRLARTGAPLSVFALLALAAGCGESFTATTEGGGSGGGGATTTTNIAGGGGSGGAPACESGMKAPCYGGPSGTQGVGVCKGGQRECVNGQWTACVGQVKPGEESCAPGPEGAQDEDCDGETDEGCACDDESTQGCYSGPPGTAGAGVCAAGTQLCQNSMWGECKGEVLPGPETCDGKDNDCDNKIDNVEGACEADGQLGECRKGSLHCSGQGLSCSPGAPAPDACDGKDNNCDGVADNSPSGEACQVEGCAGKKACIGGGLTCMLPVEVCGNLADDNCDGVTDPIGTPLFVESFNGGNQNGWDLGPEWDISPAKASSGAPPGFFDDPEDDATPTVDDNIAGVVIGGAATTEVHEPYYLTSPKIDISAVQGAVYLTFKRWLNSYFPPYMSSTVDAFDGTKWVTIWHTPTVEIEGGGVRDNGWKLRALDVTAFKNPSFRIRFGVEVMHDGALAVSSWNLDDIAIVRCVPANLFDPAAP